MTIPLRGIPLARTLRRSLGYGAACTLSALITAQAAAAQIGASPMELSIDARGAVAISVLTSLEEVEFLLGATQREELRVRVADDMSAGEVLGLPSMVSFPRIVVDGSEAAPAATLPALLDLRDESVTLRLSDVGGPDLDRLLARVRPGDVVVRVSDDAPAGALGDLLTRLSGVETSRVRVEPGR